MPKFEPIFVTVHDDAGEAFHLKIRITLDKKNFDYLYKTSRMEHGADFKGPGKNRVLRIGRHESLLYHDKARPDGRVPDQLISKVFEAARFILPASMPSSFLFSDPEWDHLFKT